MALDEEMFFSIFGDEFVEIITDLTVKHPISNGEESMEVTLPMTVKGVVKAFDGDLVYIASDGTAIDQALPYISLKHIQIVKEADEQEDLLDDVEAPDNDSGYN